MRETRLLSNRETVFSAWSVPRSYKGKKRSSERDVVENCFEFWRWQLKVIEKKWEETNQIVQKILHVLFEFTVK
jgi:hypothetical protein